MILAQVGFSLMNLFSVSMLSLVRDIRMFRSSLLGDEEA